MCRHRLPESLRKFRIQSMYQQNIYCRKTRIRHIRRRWQRIRHIHRLLWLSIWLLCIRHQGINSTQRMWENSILQHLCPGQHMCRDTPPTTAAASTVSNCSSASKVTFGKTTYYTCNTCNSGYTRTAVTVSDERCTNTTTKYICKKPTETSCDPAKCIPDPAWTCGAANSPAPKEGVCIRNYRSCNNDTCVVSTFWQCKSGYYGSPDTSHSCAKCPQPSDGTIVGTKNTNYDTPVNTHTTIDDCYVTGGTDATGRYLYTSKTSDSPYQCAYGTN